MPDALDIAEKHMARIRAKRAKTWAEIQRVEPDLAELLTQCRARFGPGTELEYLELGGKGLQEHGEC